MEDLDQETIDAVVLALQTFASGYTPSDPEGAYISRIFSNGECGLAWKALTALGVRVEKL